MRSGRGTLFIFALAFGGCAQIAGVDGDYREVSDASAGLGGAGGAAGLGGSSGVGGSAGLGGSGGGSAGTGVGGSAGTGVGGSAGSGVGGSAGGGFGGTAGAPPVCGSGKQCIDPVPTGFLGPVLLREAASSPPSCPIEYPTAGALLYGGFNSGFANCGCSCTPPSTPCTVTLQKHSSSNCLTPPLATINMPANSCVDVNVEANQYAKAGFTRNNCTPSPTTNIPTPTWTTEARYCGGADTTGTCAGGQVCVPVAPANAKLCVRQDGDVKCPTSGYTEKFLRYEGFSDTRACTNCTCGSPSGACGNVAIYAVNCSASSPSMMTYGNCYDYQITVLQGMYQAAGGSISCTKQGGTLTGSAAATNPTTFCCQP